jgi:predicted flap endonuclease-1-like 5' DNA nuclease
MERTALIERSNGCGCKEPEQQVECCALDCLEAPRFFCGQLLTDQHLNDLMTWTRAKTALARYRDGWGVACGLDIHCDEANPGGVVVSPGYARSCCGDDIVVCEDARLDLSTACDEGPDPCDELVPREKRGKGANDAQQIPVDVFISYREEQTNPEASLARTACGETGRCEFTRTRETYWLYPEPGASGDPMSYAALRWREAYDEALEVIDAFRAAFPALDGEQADSVRSWLLRWIDANPPHHFCFLRERICTADDNSLTDEAGISELLFWIAQDRRNQVMTCSCFDCGASNHGVPLGRVWLAAGGRRRECHIRAIDPFPPYRRPLSSECWPAQLGWVNAGQVIWHRRTEACVRLADLGVRIKEIVEFEPPPTLAELRGVLACNPMVRCGDERTLLSYDVEPLGDRVVGLCETATPTPRPPMVKVTKTASPSEGEPGTFVKYEYEVTNEGDEPFEAVVEDDPLGEIGTREVAPGATEKFEANADVPSDAQGKFTNTVTVTATGPGGTTTAKVSHDFTISAGPSDPPSIDLTLRGPTEVLHGREISYAIAVTNHGPVDVILKLSDQLGELPQEATEDIPMSPGGNVVFRYSHRPVSGETQVTEVVDAVGTAADGQQDTDQDRLVTKVTRQIVEPRDARLQDITGIGDTRARKLAEAAITSLEDLIEADPEEVARLLGSPTAADNARNWQEQAKRLLER